MNKTAIKIDLSAFFNDERKMVYVLVDPNWETVENLQKRVEYLFNINSVGFLTKNSYYLPPKETIEIVKFCEGLKAFAPQESLERREKKKSKKSKCMQNSSQEIETAKNRIEEVKDVQVDDSVKKKRKYYSLDSTHDVSIASIDAKRLKCSNAIKEILSPIQCDNKCMENTSTNEQMQPSTVQTQHTVEEGSNKKKKTKHSKVFKDFDVENCHQSYSRSTILKPNSSIIEQNRKPTIENETDIGVEQICNNTKPSLRSSSIHSSTFVNESKTIVEKNFKEKSLNLLNFNNPFKRQQPNHTYFNESGDIVNTTNKSQFKSDKESKALVIFRCPLQEVINMEEATKPRIFRIERNSSSSKKKNQLIEIKENIVLTDIKDIVVENKSTLVKENAAINLEYEQKIGKEVDLFKEKTDLSDTSNVEDSKNIDDTLDNNIEKSQIENNTEITFNEENSVSKLQPTKINQTCTMPVDCVDLSMDPEKDDATIPKFKINNDKHDITSDKSANDSSSDVEEIPEIIDLNETEDNCNLTSGHSPTSAYSLHGLSVDKILPFCTDISELPNINNIMVFKMAYADKKKETNFLAGKVEYINKRTKAMKVLIIDGRKETRYIESRFILNWRKSEDFTTYLQVKMCDIIEPKIYTTR